VVWLVGAILVAQVVTAIVAIWRNPPPWGQGSPLTPPDRRRRHTRKG